MSADAAVGLFAIGAVLLATLVALAWRHFREEDVGETEETLLIRTDADPWSGVDPRHGEDGNSGHG